MRYTVIVLALLFLTAPLSAQDSADQYRDPFVAGAFSFLIPGAGQGYNGQWGKGVMFLGSEVAMIWLSSSVASSRTCSGGESQTCPLAQGLAVAAVGTWVWGIVDAARSAKEINEGLELSVGGAPRGVGLSLRYRW